MTDIASTTLLKPNAALYVAGPMRGKPFFNSHAFYRAADHLRLRGLAALLPPELSRPDITWSRYRNGDEAEFTRDHPSYKIGAVLLADLGIIAEKADALLLLEEWESSRGARLEVQFAIAIGRPCFEFRVSHKGTALFQVQTSDLHRRMAVYDPNTLKRTVPEQQAQAEYQAAHAREQVQINQAKTVAPAPGATILRNDIGHALGQFGRAKDPKVRKQQPIAEGVLDYFPDAIAAVANVSFIGNEQHNPGEPLHWAREKSTDEDSACVRHILERHDVWDTDGCLHRAKQAWRALAGLQKFLEKHRADDFNARADKDAGEWIDWPETRG